MKYTTLSKVCGHLLIKHLIPKSWSWSPLCCYNSLHSSRCWNIAAGTCFHSATRALVRLCTDDGRLGLARNQDSNSSQRCLMRSRSGFCAGQSSSSTLIISLWTSLCARWYCHAETGKSLPQTVATKLEAQNHLECHCMMCSSLELRGLAQTMKKQPQTIILPPTNFTVSTMHSGR
jgi:hypothetical protein